MGLLLCLLTVGLPSVPSWGQTEATGYTLVVDEDFVRIYERWVQQKLGKVRELKVQFMVYAPLERILDCLQQERLINQWTKNHKACKVTTKGSSAWEVAILYPIPWPARNREGVLAHCLKTYSADGFTIALTSVNHPQTRLDPTATLLGKTRGSWKATRQESGGFQMTYTLITDQDQTLPRWLTDPMVRNNLVNSMAALRNLAQTDPIL